MIFSDENNSVYVRPTNPKGGSELMGNVKIEGVIKQKRRALSAISHNLIGSSQPYIRVVKKSVAEKQVICEKNHEFERRPITRSLGIQAANTKDALHRQEEKKSNPPFSNSNGSTQFIFIDEDEDEDEKLDADLPVPMFLEEPESNINQVNHIEEVEMEDINDEDLIMDIDCCDAKNPLAAVEYVDDIYSYYRKMEILSLVSPDYMAQQDDINERMRAILIDWLIEVHDKFELTSETLFLTVNLIDRFLSQQQQLPRKKLQLVGLVALLLACKYEEVSVPVVGDLIFISDKAYTRQEVLEMESVMLNTLQFNMSLPTPYAFMQRFLKAAQSDMKLELLSFFLIELCLVEYQMLKYAPSLLAASAIYTAQCTLYGFKEWNKTCEWHTCYSQDKLLECSKLIVSFHQKAGIGRLTGVHRKYSSSKFGFAAKCESAQFLLDTDI